MTQKVKLGVEAGAGPPPGYRWSVRYLIAAEREARTFLDDAQYEHVIDQLRALARDEDPTHPKTVDVKAIQDHYELRDCGGPLGSMAIRVFFGLDKKTTSIVILGAQKKEKQKTPEQTKVLMRNRWRRYLRGDFDAKEENSRE